MKPIEDTPGGHPYYSYGLLRSPNWVEAWPCWMGGGWHGRNGSFFDGLRLQDGWHFSMRVDKPGWEWEKLTHRQVLAMDDRLPKPGTDEPGVSPWIVEELRNGTFRALIQLAREVGPAVAFSVRPALASPIWTPTNHEGDYERLFTKVVQHSQSGGECWDYEITRSGFQAYVIQPTPIFDVIRSDVGYWADRNEKDRILRPPYRLVDDREWELTRWDQVERSFPARLGRAQAECNEAWNGALCVA